MNPKLKHSVTPLQPSLHNSVHIHTGLSTTLEAKPSVHSRLSYTIPKVPSSFLALILRKPHTLKNRSPYLKPRLESQGFWTVVTGGSGDLCGTPDNICPTFHLYLDTPRGHS